MRKLILAVLAVCVSAPVPMFAASAADGDDKVVCRSSRDHNVGTRIRAPRVCRTRAEWRRVEDRTASEMQQIRERQTPESPTGGAAGAAGGPSA